MVEHSSSEHAYIVVVREPAGAPGAGPATPARVPVSGRCIIGRAADCGIIIDDAAASRRHCEVFQRQGHFICNDLGSTNGTTVNGLPATNASLHPGDRIQIGQTVLRFELESPRPPAVDVSDGAVLQSALRDWSTADHAPPESARLEALLRAVYAVVNEIASNYDPCSLLDALLQTASQAIRAERGAVVFPAEGGGPFRPCRDCGRFHTIEEGRLRHVTAGEVRVSETVARRVIADGESLLCRDIGEDQELSTARSVMSLHLRSIIGVPLRGKGGVQGGLFFTSSTERAYGHEDLLLATAVGNSAGLAVENAWMHRQLLEKQRMEQEIEHAWSIQQSFLVKDWPPADGGFDVFGQMRPAKIVGGDFYDLVRPSPERVGLLVGDVSGKGVPAALTMAQLLAEFRARVLQAIAPAEVVAALNRQLLNQAWRGLFATLCYIDLDLARGTARMANAGHPPAVRLRRDGAELLEGASGPPAGVIEDAGWSEAEVVLAPGEGLLLYTDGILEACASPSRRDRQFGAEGILAAAQDYGRQGARAVVDAMMSAVDRFCAPDAPQDDCTLLACRLADPPGAGG